MSPCRFAVASSLCIARTWYRVPLPFGSRVMIAVNWDEVILRAVPGTEGARPHEPLVLHDLEIAPGVVHGRAVGPAHHGPELPARAQVDLALRREPRPGAEPLLEVLGLRPRPPDFLGRHVDDALQHQVELRVNLHRASP